MGRLMSLFSRHFRAETALNLIKTARWHLSGRVIRESVSSLYLGLCCYINWRTIFEIKRGGVLSLNDGGFLSVGVEGGGFEGWFGPCKILIEKDGKFSAHGYVEIGRGSLVWVRAGGQLRIGAGTYFSGGGKLICSSEVVVGASCAVGWGVTIIDDDFHKFSIDGRVTTKCLPIVIGDGVWIGHDATILKGVRIGDGAIVAARSVVTRDVPAGALVAGVPARVVHHRAVRID